VGSGSRALGQLQGEGGGWCEPSLALQAQELGLRLDTPCLPTARVLSSEAVDTSASCFQKRSEPLAGKSSGDYMSGF
jgi:hypothetical protein